MDDRPPMRIDTTKLIISSKDGNGAGYSAPLFLIGAPWRTANRGNQPHLQDRPEKIDIVLVYPNMQWEDQGAGAD